MGTGRNSAAAASHILRLCARASHSSSSKDQDCGVRTSFGKISFLTQSLALKCVCHSCDYCVCRFKEVPSMSCQDLVLHTTSGFFTSLDLSFCCFCHSQALSSASKLQGWKEEKVPRNQDNLQSLHPSTPLTCPSKGMAYHHLTES